MPHRIYTHPCCASLNPEASRSPQCLLCGAPGVPAGWALSDRELQVRSLLTHGLQPVGPHEELAQELLSPLRAQCPDCGGSGYLGRERPARCALCEGTGGFWTGSEETLTAAYREVIRRHPMAYSWGPGALTPFRLGLEGSEVDR